MDKLTFAERKQYEFLLYRYNKLPTDVKQLQEMVSARDQVITELTAPVLNRKVTICWNCHEKLIDEGVSGTMQISKDEKETS